MTLSYAAWIEGQFTVPVTSHCSYCEARDATVRAADPNVSASAGQDPVCESFWK